MVSGAYAANVSGFRMRGADHAGPREKLSATRSLSAPSERQRLSAAGPLARHPGVSHAGYFALVLVSWRPGVLSNRYPMQLHWRAVEKINAQGLSIGRIQTAGPFCAMDLCTPMEYNLVMTFVETKHE